ncbi:MAG: M67 family metallopeptidase [Bacteroides sp.]|nr:M67 family metallopeptidase [Bacteroides sp.]
MGLTIRGTVVAEMIRQATAELPNESCGYLLGKEELVTENYKMTNRDASPEHFSFDPKEQFAAIRYARSNRLQVIANWHSHPETPSRPSAEDIRLAYDPGILYFILSLAAEEPVLKAFRIREGNSEEVELEIIK